MFDAVFPFDLGIVLVAGIESADGVVSLERHERVALAHGVCIAWAGLRENASQPVDFSQPDGIGVMTCNRLACTPPRIIQLSLRSGRLGSFSF